jgi:hypothetical protein
MDGSHSIKIIPIPMIDYIAVLVLAGLFWLYLRLARIDFPPLEPKPAPPFVIIPLE